MKAAEFSKAAVGKEASLGSEEGEGTERGPEIAAESGGDGFLAKEGELFEGSVVLESNQLCE